jgi:protein-disulfide isomerase
MPSGRGTRKQSRRSPPLRPYFIGALVAVIAVGALLLIGSLTRDNGPSPDAEIIVPTPRPAEIPQSGRTFGQAEAPVTVQEYLDFQCPICLRAELEVLPGIEESFIKPGVAD